MEGAEFLNTYPRSATWNNILIQSHWVKDSNWDTLQILGLL